MHGMQVDVRSELSTPKMQGTWLLTGYQQGKGRVFGKLTVEAGSAPDEFVTKTDIEYASTGITVSRTGKGVIYTGYSWRGRSNGKAPASAADPAAEWRPHAHPVQPGAGGRRHP